MRDLRALAVVFAEAVVDVADADVDVPYGDPAAIRDELDDGAELELRAGGWWHFE